MEDNKNTTASTNKIENVMGIDEKEEGYTENLSCEGNQQTSKVAIGSNSIIDVLGVDEHKELEKNQNKSDISSKSRENFGNRGIREYSARIPFLNETKRPNSAPVNSHRRRQELFQNEQFKLGLPSTFEESETTIYTNKETQNGKTTSNELQVYPKQGKGFLLIINFMFPGDSSERKASEEDVGRLCMFFTKLKYDINCRSDMTKKELDSLLQDVRQQYLERDALKYYCFICIIMSHGNQRGICTNTDEITIENIVKHFKNDQASQFIGKPKIFMVQACRGDTHQQKQMVQSDSADSKISLPNDADVLVIYATTKGHLCYRKTGDTNWNGAWFINSFLDAAQLYSKQDIERIMTAVRHDLSHNPQYEAENQRCQISVSETTLTKLFHL